MPFRGIVKTPKPEIRKKKKILAKQSKALSKMASSSSEAPAEGTVYFWNPDGNNGYMSQWEPSPFTHEGITYATAEMWMMIQKAKLFKDDEIASQMAATTDPKIHKALGRKVRGYDGKIWDQQKLRIVEEGNWWKFTSGERAEELKVLLLATGEKELVEASPFDRIWGVGFGEKNADENRKRWGQNLLGIALMNVRKRIREEEGKEEKTA
jgi:ribA/ribD-fused uncharacterized protein